MVGTLDVPVEQFVIVQNLRLIQSNQGEVGVVALGQPALTRQFEALRDICSQQAGEARQRAGIARE